MLELSFNSNQLLNAPAPPKFPAKLKWKVSTSLLPPARTGVTAPVIDNTIYVIGGSNVSTAIAAVTTGEESNNNGITWNYGPALPAPLMNHASVKWAQPRWRAPTQPDTYNKVIFVIGGAAAGRWGSKVICYNPQTWRWSQVYTGANPPTACTAPPNFPEWPELCQPRQSCIANMYYKPHWFNDTSGAPSSGGAAPLPKVWANDRIVVMGGINMDGRITSVETLELLGNPSPPPPTPSPPPPKQHWKPYENVFSYGSDNNCDPQCPPGV